jgi:hypothetical protein
MYKKSYNKHDSTYKYVNSAKCNECFRENVIKNKREYYQRMKDHYKEYYLSDVNKEKRNKRLRERREKEPEVKTINSLKARIHEVLRGYKGCSSSKLLDCTREQLYKWLESQFTDMMSWENYGKIWHIDHVVPISFFDNTIIEEQSIAFNWTNLKPLCSKMNMSKSSKIDKEYILAHFQNIKKFCETNQGYQVSVERCLWQRIELWYGKNPHDKDTDFEKYLTWAIRSQAPTSVNDKDMGKVQRLNDNGLEMSNQHQ